MRQAGHVQYMIVVIQCTCNNGFQLAMLQDRLRDLMFPVLMDLKIHFCCKIFSMCRSPAYLYSVFHGTEQSAHHLHLQIRMQNVPIVVHDYELMH